MIVLKNVTYKYPNGIVAVKNFSAKIDSSITILLGPNGAGKTTLLKIMGLIYKPHRGEVIIDGKNFWLLDEKERLSIRRRVVYVHEKPKLFRGRVLDNVAFPLLIRGYNKEDAKRRALKVLKELKIEHLSNRTRKELSAGEIQLVAFARAVAVNPKYLLLDEPTTSLDLEKRRILINYIKRLSKNGTKVIISTHDRLIALSLAKKVIIIEAGKLKKYVGPEYILEDVKRDIAGLKFFNNFNEL